MPLGFLLPREAVIGVLYTVMRGLGVRCACLSAMLALEAGPRPSLGDLRPDDGSPASLAAAPFSFSSNATAALSSRDRLTPIAGGSGRMPAMTFSLPESESESAPLSDGLAAGAAGRRALRAIVQAADFSGLRLGVGVLLGFLGTELLLLEVDTSLFGDGVKPSWPSSWLSSRWLSPPSPPPSPSSSSSPRGA